MPAGHRRPSHQRRKGAGRAADHDVLRTGALEPDGVDEDVEQEPASASQALSGLTRYQKTAKASQPERHAERQPEAGGVMRPAGIGRSRVRAIRLSMSRSNHMLIALAPPAIR